MNSKTLPRNAGIAIGLTCALLIAGLTTGRIDRSDSPPGPIISECDGALSEIVIQYVAGSDAVIPVYRDFLRQLDAGVRVDVACPDRASFNELIAKVGKSRSMCFPVIVHHPMTVWSRDRWIALASEDGGRTMLLAPRAEAGTENWPARRGDQQLAFDLSAADPTKSVSARRSGLYFEGGDFLADDSRVFVTPAVGRANIQRSVDSVEELRSRLRAILGKPVVMLDEAPDHHAGMFMMAVGNNVMLVGDPAMGKSLLQSATHPPPIPGGADWSPRTQELFDAVARQVSALGYHVVRIPTVVANDGKSYLTYVNVITDHRDGRRIVYLPQFCGADALNARAVSIWRELGYKVRLVDCTSTYALFGNLHCLVNVLRRT